MLYVFIALAFKSRLKQYLTYLDLISTVTFTSKISQRHSFSLFYSSWYMLLLQPKALVVFRCVHLFRCISFPLAQHHRPSSSSVSNFYMSLSCLGGDCFDILSFDVPPEVIGQNNYERAAKLRWREERVGWGIQRSNLRYLCWCRDSVPPRSIVQAFWIELLTITPSFRLCRWSGTVVFHCSRGMYI